MPYDLQTNEFRCKYALNWSKAEPDVQLINDCRSVADQMTVLLHGIEEAAGYEHQGQAPSQALLCETDRKIFDLIEQIVVTPAVSNYGMESKRMVADRLLAIDWYEEPSPFRDALLFSFVLDAARLQYPTVLHEKTFVPEDLEATSAAIARANLCLTIIKDLAAEFVRKDQDAEDSPINQDGRDAVIVALSEHKKTAVKALVGVRAFSVRAIHAKRAVLRRMLGSGMYDSDADHLRVELARSYFRDLKTFLQDMSQEEHEKVAGHSMIWSSFPAPSPG